MQLLEQYFQHIRAYHSYNKMDQITRKLANSWLEIYR